ncbi:MAG: diaminopimelate decarboxylase [Fibrobacterota bacterium]
MNEFQYQNNILHCEDIPVRRLAEKYGTPLYIYSKAAFLNRFQELRQGFSGLDPLICYSVKSNSNIAILKLLAQAGAGADIVSGGELFRCLKAGMTPDKIVFAGVGKTAEEITYALDNGIHLFNVESMAEMRAISSLAKAGGQTARVGIRINPDVDANTHAKTTTGKKENKFGLNISQAVEYYREAAALPNLKVAGVDVHLGSPIFSIEPYLSALRKLLPLIAELRKNGIALEELDLGGGFGVVYKDENPFTPAQLAAEIGPAIRDTGLKLIVEPGRYIAGNSAILVTRVTYTKTTDVKRFLILDAGMNDLLRPAFYGSFHDIQPVEPREGDRAVCDVVGPICESSDIFGKDRELPGVMENDYLSLMSAGAYGFAMSSNYNSRPRACEVLVDRDRAVVIRTRETHADLIRGERLDG